MSAPHSRSPVLEGEAQSPEPRGRRPGCRQVPPTASEPWGTPGPRSRQGRRRRRVAGPDSRPRSPRPPRGVSVCPLHLAVSHPAGRGPQEPRPAQPGRLVFGVAAGRSPARDTPPRSAGGAGTAGCAACAAPARSPPRRPGLGSLTKARVSVPRVPRGPGARDPGPCPPPHVSTRVTRPGCARAVTQPLQDAPRPAPPGPAWPASPPPPRPRPLHPAPRPVPAAVRGVHRGALPVLGRPTERRLPWDAGSGQAPPRPSAGRVAPREPLPPHAVWVCSAQVPLSSSSLRSLPGAQQFSPHSAPPALPRGPSPCMRLIPRCRPQKKAPLVCKMGPGCSLRPKGRSLRRHPGQPRGCFQHLQERVPGGGAPGPTLEAGAGLAGRSRLFWCAWLLSAPAEIQWAQQSVFILFSWGPGSF